MAQQVYLQTGDTLPAAPRPPHSLKKLGRLGPLVEYPVIFLKIFF